MADDDVTVPDEQDTFAAEQERQVRTGTNSPIRRGDVTLRYPHIGYFGVLHDRPKSRGRGDPHRDTGYGAATARRLDRAIVVYGGGASAIGYFEDDLAKG